MECPICLNIYSRSTTVALKLQCCHTICTPCCKRITNNNTVKCPICLKETPNASNLGLCETIMNIIKSKENLKNSQIINNTGKVSFIVRNLLGQVLNLTLSKNFTILKVKETIKDSENVSVNSQWLIHNGRTLNNEETLAEADIKDMDIIYLVFRSFGG